MSFILDLDEFNMQQQCANLQPNLVSNYDDSILKPRYMDTMDMEVDAEKTKPWLEITEQPTDKFRFRYLSEMNGTHGSLTGKNTNRSKKTYPSVRLHGYNQSAIIRCSLFQNNKKSLHSHSLVVRLGEKDKSDPHDVNVSPGHYEAVFRGMGIIQTAKKFMDEELLHKLTKRLEFEENRLATEYECVKILPSKVKEALKTINLNQVCLIFEAYTRDEYGNPCYVCDPVISEPINNMKSALTGELKITRLSLACSSVCGNEELFLFVEKVGKKNIQVKFFQHDGDDAWEDFGRFSEADVHHQYAIALRTPPYRNGMNITQDVKVYIQLYRPSDESVSEPVEFYYKPLNSMSDYKEDKPFSLSDFPSVLNQEPMTISREFNKSGMIRSLMAKLNSSEFLTDFSNHVQKNSTELKKLVKPKLEMDGETTESNVNLSYQTLCDLVDYVISPCETDEKAKYYMEQLFIKNNSKNKNLFHFFIQLAPEGDTFMYDLIDKYNLPDLLLLTNQHGENCIHIAVKYNKPEHIPKLYKYGINIDGINNDGDTPLHVSVKHKHNECVASLLNKDHSISTDVVNNDGMTPIHLATKSNNPKAFRMLLDAGASVNICETKTGNNVLHLAIEMNSEEMVKIIFDEVADINLNKKNYANYTPFQWANVRNSLSSIVDMLADKFEGSNMMLESEIKKENEDSIDSFKSESLEDEDATTEDSENFIENPSEYFNLFDESCLEKLSAIFNKNEKWKQLAQRLQYSKAFVDIWQKSKNPSMMLFKFSQNRKVSTNVFINLFKSLGEWDALLCIDEIMARNIEQSDE